MTFPVLTEWQKQFNEAGSAKIRSSQITNNLRRDVGFLMISYPIIKPHLEDSMSSHLVKPHVVKDGL